MRVKQTKRKSKFGNLPGPGPGRPKGSRNKLTNNMLEILNDIVMPFIKDPDTIKAFKEQKLIESRARPLKYYEELIIPLIRLLPKNIELSGDLGVAFDPYAGLSGPEIAKKLEDMVKALKKRPRIASKASKKRKG